MKAASDITVATEAHGFHRRGTHRTRVKTRPAGAPGLQRAEVLAMVEEQFREIRHELDSQLARMSQIQHQLNEIHSAIMMSVLGLAITSTHNDTYKE